MLWQPYLLLWRRRRESAPLEAINTTGVQGGRRAATSMGFTVLLVVCLVADDAPSAPAANVAELLLGSGLAHGVHVDVFRVRQRQLDQPLTFPHGLAAKVALARVSVAPNGSPEGVDAVRVDAPFLRWNVWCAGHFLFCVFYVDVVAVNPMFAMRTNNLVGFLRAGDTSSLVDDELRFLFTVVQRQFDGFSTHAMILVKPCLAIIA